MKSNHTQRMAWLDSLRAIAALLVVFQHYFYDRYFTGAADNIYLTASYEIFRSVNFGKMGVVVFFFISGFIIPQSLLQARTSKPIQSFFIARFFRLYPAYWCSVLVAAYLYAKFGTAQFYLNLTMIQQFFGSENLLGVYWTLQIELIFYVLCAYLLYRNWIGKAATSVLMFFLFMGLALLASTLRYYTTYSIPVAIPLCLSVMFLGTAYYWYQLSSITAKHFNGLVIVFLICLLPICMLAYGRDTGFSERWYAYYLSYVIGMSLFFLLTSKYKIQHPVFVYLGLISYSIYLFHPFFMLTLLPSATLNLIANSAMTIGVAAIVYFLVEVPGRKVGKALKTFLVENKKVSAVQVEA